MCLANLQAQNALVTMQTHTDDKILNTDALVSKLIH